MQVGLDGTVGILMTIEDLLIKEEGRIMKGGRHIAYQDHLGYWTIGYGCLIDGRKGGGLTEDQAMYLLHGEIAEKRAELDAQLPWWRELNDARQTVVLAMAFQMGTDGVLGFKNTLAMLKAGDYNGAANGIRRSLWAIQTPARAERMARVIETGEFQ
jgi:lysozyme